MSDILQTVQKHGQANNGNIMAAKETAQVFQFVNDMKDYSVTLSDLAENISQASSTELQKVVENACDVCNNCNTTIRSFSDGVKSVTNATGSLVEKISPTTGQTIKETCTSFLDEASGAQQAAVVQDQLHQYLEQETLN
jgi:hypothetical protein